MKRLDHTAGLTPASSLLAPKRRQATLVTLAVATEAAAADERVQRARRSWAARG